MTHGLKLERLDDGRLMAQRDGAQAVPVSPQLCFPWSDPGRYISLRDGGDREVALIEDLDGLDPGSQQAVRAGLKESAFVFEIERVLSLETEFELRHWKVLTRQGPLSFQTKLDQWPWQTPRGGLLLRDVAGNLLHIPDSAALDRASRRLIWAFVD